MRRRWFGVLAAFALVFIAACDGSSGASEAPAEPAGAPLIVSARVVCRLVADNLQARSIQATGTDGTQSAVAADGTQYWFFGDTIRTIASGRQDVVPAAIATTRDTNASDCLDLKFKSENGSVAPMIPPGDETTAWPDGVLPLDNGAILFYMVKAVRTSPFYWYVGSVGLGRLNPGSLTGTRLTEVIWDERSGFPSRVVGVRSPIRQDDDVFVYIKTEDGANFVGRAPLASMELASAYTYWDGATWTDEPARAAPMWPPPESLFPADNGVQVTWEPRIGAWLALYNDEMARIAVRTAPDPWGPWSEPVRWLDCQPLVGEEYPYCYTGELHRHLSTESDDRVYMTFASQEPYDVALLELRIGVPIYEWQSGDEYRYAAASPGRGWARGDTALHGLASPPAGDSGGFRSIGDGAYLAAAPSPGLPSAPVYAWARDGVTRYTADALEGWQRGAVAGYTPCAGLAERISGCP
jgi:hypothetical protein